MKNNNTSKKQSTYFSSNSLIDRPFIFFIPISLILTIVPLLVRVKSVRLDEATTNLYGSASQFDLFSQLKASVLFYFSIALIIISVFFFKRIFEKKDKIINSILIATAIFWIFTLCSTIFSIHKDYAINGAFDRCEGFITITCYMILFIYSIYTFKTTKNYKYMLIAIFIVVTINAFLGVFQYFGKDLINSKLGLLLVTGKTTQKLSLMYETGKLYGTLYHYNFVGSFVAIVLPLLFSLTIFEKKLIYKIALGICSLLSLWLLFGSTSRAGIIGVTASFILGIIIFGRAILKKWKPVLIIFVSIIILVVGLNSVTKGIIFERIPSLIADSLSVFKDTSNFDYTNYTPVKNVKNVDKHAEVTLQNNEIIKISYENNKYVFKNSNDQVINYAENNEVFTTTDPAFQNTSFTTKKVKSTDKLGYISLNIDGKTTFSFRLGKDYSVHLTKLTSKDDVDIVFPETVPLFNGKEKLGSMRGYIWSRSIPLLKNNIIIGGGPDTFIYQFPQLDMIGKYYAYDTPNILVDKAHNLYLEIALNDGLISLIAFLCMFLIYTFDTIKLYAFKKDYNNSEILGVATSLGVIGYLFAGIFNDSVISVAPIFWIVFGVGVAINFINRKAAKHIEA